MPVFVLASVKHILKHHSSWVEHFSIDIFIVIHPLTISRVPSGMKILLDDCPEG